MAGFSRAPNNIHAKNTSSIRLSGHAVSLQKRTFKLPPIELEGRKKFPARLPPTELEARKKLPGCKSLRPPPPPPSPAPWSWYHRDCLQRSPNEAPRRQERRTTADEEPAVAYTPTEASLSDSVEPDSPPPVMERSVSVSCSNQGSFLSESSIKDVIFEKCTDYKRSDLKSKWLASWANIGRWSGLFEDTRTTLTGTGGPQRRSVPQEEPKRTRFVNDRESEMSAFLLQVAQAVFEEMVSLDQLIKRILEFAQRLVNADRASLFLVDYRNSELVSTVFDLKYEPNQQDNDMSKKEIRMPLNKGIAGHVAMFGETMNIPDAYSDQRFNKAVDEATGYRTSSILCMPIKVQGKVIAVVQMVNKRDLKVFQSEDEAAFQVFSTFFGLALHHARLYDKIMRKEQKYRIALEVLSYHNTCAEEDVTALLEDKNKEVTINFNDFMLNPFKVNDVDKCKGVITMFDDLFDITKFDVTVLTRFVLTVKKNYRKVPYHNFDHGWSVANAMYVILKHDTENRINYQTRLALFVACLCHDLDHRGYTNRYMSDIASPLAAMYSTSTLEHHHFNITVTILQQEGHNIFSQMSGEEYKDILGLIRNCILATDLAVFFPNLKKINELIFETRNFNWDEESHRTLGRGVLMTSSDLVAAAKPFSVQLETARIIQEEFYHQGDLEKLAGKIPIPMMDREKPEELPASQVGFLSQIAVPCYKALHQLFPLTEPMFALVDKNLKAWNIQAAADKMSRSCNNCEKMTIKNY